MNDHLKLIKKDIEDIFLCISKGKTSAFIYRENKDFFEELLGKKFSAIIDDEILARIDSKKISPKDKLLLQNYLDYLNMIED